MSTAPAAGVGPPPAADQGLPIATGPGPPPATGPGTPPAAGQDTQPAAPGVFALLADGATAEIRAATPADLAAVCGMHAAMSPENLYLRFFSVSKDAAEREARRLCRPAGPDHAALLACLDGKVVGAASYEPTSTAGVAEVAFAVADGMHGRGVATLLLEHLVSLARIRHLTAFTAETLAENSAMLRVFADAGLGAVRHWADGVVELTHPHSPAGRAEPGQLVPRNGGGARAAGRRRQPGAPAAPGVCRRGRGEPEGGIGRPDDPAQHPRRRLRRAALRGEPERRRDRRGAVRSLGGGAARAGGSRRARGAAARGRRGRAGLR